MIHLKSNEEIEKVYRAGQIVKDTLCMLEEYVVPGVKTLELDRRAEEFIKSRGALPGFKGLYGFPATLCISIEDEVVHGIPNNRKLKEGEIVSVDCGSYIDDFYGDHARTFPVGKINNEKRKLLNETEICLTKGIEQVVVNNTVGDIGSVVQTHAESLGYGVVKELVGHGIGKKLHEEPQIPNYGKSGRGPKIQVGMCLAIEPMINMGTPDIYTGKDEWTVYTADGKPSAHFEHTVALTEKGVRILTK